jgi:DNA-binding transcriptional regulator YiaG
LPNIAVVLKDEIARLARKELRSETEKLKKASTQYRSEIAALKRRVAALEQQGGRLEKQAARNAPPAEAAGQAETRVRFSAKGLQSQRRRLGLSAAGLGTLLGVSAQTVYNWEAGSSRPRGQQMAAIAALRQVGKREAEARLQELAA